MISKIFKSRIPSCNYAFRDGTVAHFISGSYHTADASKITELMNEIKAIGQNASMNPYLYVDENEQEIDSEALTPYEIMKQQAYEQAKADLIAAGQMSNTKSTSDATAFSTSMTNSVTANAAESNGAPGTVGLAKLASLAKK